MSQATEDREETVSPEEEQTEPVVSRRLPRWKIVLVSLALLIGVAGMVLHPQSPSDVQETRTVGNLSAGGADPLSDPPAFRSDPVPAFEMMEEPTEETLPPDWERRLKEETCPASTGCWRIGSLFEDWSPLLTRLGFSFCGWIQHRLCAADLAAHDRLSGRFWSCWRCLGCSISACCISTGRISRRVISRSLSWVLPRAENFRDFITHNLSSSGMAAMGILTGLTRR